MVTTREERGRLDTALEALGAAVVHVPLVEVVEPSDGGAALDAALSDLGSYDWLIVSSRHGAGRVAAAAAVVDGLRSAAVGGRTAAVLERGLDRPIDVVPERQTGADLAAAMPEPGAHPRVLVAQAERADSGLVAGLIDRGYDVDVVAAYRTTARRPSADERQTALAADAVTFASGSAARSWVDGIGLDTPPVVAVIGPTTAEVAGAAGVAPTHEAATHDVDGLVAVVLDALRVR